VNGLPFLPVAKIVKRSRWARRSKVKRAISRGSDLSIIAAGIGP
jgi:hypothetical protein